MQTFPDNYTNKNGLNPFFLKRVFVFRGRITLKKSLPCGKIKSYDRQSFIS